MVHGIGTNPQNIAQIALKYSFFLWTNSNACQPGPNIPKLATADAM
jgi:hypothetical protein